MQLSKINTLLVDVFLLTSLGLLALYSLFSILINSRSIHSTQWVVFIALFFIISIEGMVWRTRQDIAISERIGHYPTKKRWSSVALFFQSMNFLQSFLAILGIVFLVGLFSYVTIQSFSRGFIQSSPSFYLLLSFWIVYIIIRKPLHVALKKLVQPVNTFFKKGLPYYTIIKNGIRIDLKIHGMQPPERNIITLFFNEIHELRVLTYAEAEAFLKYDVGPNVQLAFREGKGWHDYAKGVIPRPLVFRNYGSAGKIVFLRGKDFFYFISFDTDDLSDLIKAYDNYKSIHHKK